MSASLIILKHEKNYQKKAEAFIVKKIKRTFLTKQHNNNFKTIYFLNQNMEDGWCWWYANDVCLYYIIVFLNS